MAIHEFAGKPAPLSMRLDVGALLKSYFTDKPDPSDPAQRVSFGTSGHRGSALSRSFNEPHILAIAQAIVEHRHSEGIDGPLYVGMDTHALSEPAQTTALEVFAANHVPVRVAAPGVFTPTPAVSFAVLNHERGKADGVVITPSHNPPEDGGFKYNPPHGGPADTTITAAIEERANEILEQGLGAVQRMPIARARSAITTETHDFVTPYVAALGDVVDMEAIAGSKIHIGVDPMGGAGVAYWAPIAERYNLNLEVTNTVVDPTFSFMTLDKDGRIRMDCSSPYAMAGLVAMADKFDIAFGNDTDFDRHGVVTPAHGLLNPNHVLSVAVDYLFSSRDQWSSSMAVGKTLVSSAMIDRVAAALDRTVAEVSVGFKWFVQGLLTGALGFGGEESAGASFCRRDGSVWTTDKDGFVMDLLCAEIAAVMQKDLGDLYVELTEKFGEPVYERIDVPATPEQKAKLKNLSASSITARELAGDPIEYAITKAPYNDAPIGGLKVGSTRGWFAARPSGTENIYKIYAESFVDREHLSRIQEQARELVQSVL